MAQAKKAVKKPVKNSGKKSTLKAGKKTTSEILSPAQEKFCLEYRKHEGNGTAAAIAAGYSERTAAQQATRLLRNVNIMKRIKELADDAADVQARIRAIDVLNKMDGVYVIKTEVKISGNVNVLLKRRKKE